MAASGLMDAYTIRARRMPVLIVALPAVVLLAVSVLNRSSFGIATGIVVAVGSALGAHLGRDRGRNLQPDLWKKWDGPPTTQALRWRGPDPAPLVAQRHAEVARALGIRLATKDEEDEARDAADAEYAAAITKLIALTRDHKKFRMIFEENVNYGFRRNCLGLKWYGLTLSVTITVLSTLLLLLGSGDFERRALHFGWALAIAVLLSIFWAAIVRPSWVKVPADAYAGRLLEALYVL